MEMTAVLAVVGMLAGIAVLTISQKAGKGSLKKEAGEIINILKQAQNAAAQSDRRYVVLFDELEQSYTLMQVNTINDLPSMDLPDEEKILSTTMLSERCWFVSIWFDDGIDTEALGDDEDMGQKQAYFVAGRTGWQNGGKIRLLDIDGNPYSIIVDRLSRNITLVEGDAPTEHMEPIENLVF